jgi:hypothetical protein
MSEVNKHYLSLPRKDGDEMELLGNDIDSFFVSHERLIARVYAGKKDGWDHYDTIVFTMEELLQVVTDLHFFVKLAKKHYHLEKVSVITPEI